MSKKWIKTQNVILYELTDLQCRKVGSILRLWDVMVLEINQYWPWTWYDGIMVSWIRDLTRKLDLIYKWDLLWIRWLLLRIGWRNWGSIVVVFDGLLHILTQFQQKNFCASYFGKTVMWFLKYDARFNFFLQNYTKYKINSRTVILQHFGT